MLLLQSQEDFCFTQRFKGQSFCQHYEYTCPEAIPWLRSSANHHPSEKEKISLFYNSDTNRVELFVSEPLSWWPESPHHPLQPSEVLEVAELGSPVIDVEFPPFITCNRMKQFLLVTGEMALLPESIPSACFASGQPVGKPCGQICFDSCRRMCDLIISGGSTIGHEIAPLTIGTGPSSNAAQPPSRLHLLLLSVWTAEGWEVLWTQQDGPEPLPWGSIRPKPALQHQLN